MKLHPMMLLLAVGASALLSACEEEFKAASATTPREEIEAKSNGVMFTITNALEWPKGENDDPTRCHMNAQVCGVQETTDSEGQKHEVSGGCTTLVGTINAEATQTYWLSPAQVTALRSTTGKMQLWYRITCQVTNWWHPGYPTMQLNADVSAGKQVLDVRVVTPCATSYKHTIVERYEEP